MIDLPETAPIQYALPDRVHVLVATPNFTNSFPAEVHVSHIECCVKWTQWKIKFNWTIIGRTFVHFARTQACQAMIDGGFTHLFWVDDDAVIDPEILPRFLAHDKEVMIAPYPMRRPPYQVGVLSSTTGNFHEHETYRNFTLADLNQGVIEVDGGGTHCMLVRRDVLEKHGDNSLRGPGYPPSLANLIETLSPGQRKIIDQFVGDLPDESLSMKEEDDLGKPYFMMPKTGTEDMYFCGTEGIVYGDFQDISVPSHEVITHNGRMEQTNQFHQRPYAGELVIIKPRFTEALRLTPNHPLLTSNSSRRWLEAGKLKGTEKLFFPKPKLNHYIHHIDLIPYASGAQIDDQGIWFKRTTVKASKIPTSVAMTAELAWLFGFYVAEGSCTKNNVCFSFNAEKEQAFASRVKNIIQQSFGINRIEVTRNGNAGRVRFTNTTLARFFGETFGRHSHHKRFPKWMADNLKFSGEALRGLWDGDGMWGKNQVLTTTSRVLAHQVKNLLAANDVLASLRVGSNRPPHARNYTIRTLASYRAHFGHLLGVELPPKLTTAADLALFTERANGMSGWWLPIERITREPFEGTVYNMGVLNANSYVLNGIAVHNCYRVKKKGVKVWCDTDVWANHVGFNPIITKEFTQKMEALHLPASAASPGAILVQPIGGVRNSGILKVNAETNLI